GEQPQSLGHVVPILDGLWPARLQERVERVEVEVVQGGTQGGRPLEGTRSRWRQAHLGISVISPSSVANIQVRSRIMLSRVVSGAFSAAKKAGSVLSTQPTRRAAPSAGKYLITGGSVSASS